jgi:hypothetical protein
MSNNDVETGQVVVVEGSIVVPPTHTHDISNGYIKYDTIKSKITA